jgi:S-DNA-T family DNA segregation ATPase FtsK/SpoIIIE
MTYSLNTLNDKKSSLEPTATERLASELVLVLGVLILVFWVLALASYTTDDAAWSTSGVGSLTSNWGGRLGAHVADLSYYFFGFSIWWCVVALTSAWLGLFVGWINNGKASQVSSNVSGNHVLPTHIRVALGVILLMCVSTAMEWTRLYRFESQLPGHAGGVLGYILGQFSLTLLGFTGSALACISVGVVAVSMLFNFSWSRIALKLG